MKIAVIYSDKKIYVEFSPEKFLALLKQYHEEHGSLDVAMEKIIEDLKKATLNK
jgi:hypothetical protein